MERVSQVDPHSSANTSGDAQWDASSRPPRPRGPAGAGPDRSVPAVGTGNPSDPAPSWLFADEEPTPRRSRRHLLVGLAVLPWLAAIVVFLRPAGGAAVDPRDPAAAASLAPAPASTAPDAASSPRAVPSPARPAAVGTPTAASAAEQLTAGGGPRVATTLADATALAVMLARDWLGGVGPRTATFESALLPDSYIDQLAVEAIDHPGPGHVVVTILALALHSDGDDYDRAELLRVAVPIAVDLTGARPAGTPWLLAPPIREVAAPTAHEVDDPTLVPEAIGALEAAGYRDVEVTAIHQTEGWPFIALVEAVAPGAGTRDRHTVWLRPYRHGFVVAGDRPTPQEEGP